MIRTDPSTTFGPGLIGVSVTISRSRANEVNDDALAMLLGREAARQVREFLAAEEVEDNG